MNFRLVVLPTGRTLLAPRDRPMEVDQLRTMAELLRSDDLGLFAEPLQIIDLRGEHWRVGEVEHRGPREWEP